MEDFQSRVIEEKQELDNKKAKLSMFLSSIHKQDLPYKEQERLNRQCVIMGIYSDILQERIVAFN